jgi:hypothetical protein
MTFNKQWPERVFTVKDEGERPRIITVKGRDRWALEHLIHAGAQGCTPIDRPRPRWSAYVFKLRKKGVNIETLHESHEGPFPGYHARYVLRSSVTPGRKALA